MFAWKSVKWNENFRKVPIRTGDEHAMWPIKGGTNPNNNLISYERGLNSEQNTANHKFIRYSYLKLSSSKVIKNPNMEAAILFSKQTGSDVIYSIRRILFYVFLYNSFPDFMSLRNVVMVWGSRTFLSKHVFPKTMRQNSMFLHCQKKISCEFIKKYISSYSPIE